VRTPLIALALAFAGLAVAGCGGDDSGQTIEPITIPSVTAPTISTSGFTSAEPTTTAKSFTTTPQSGKTFNPNAPDSFKNDIPPPRGSPQETFEKQCQKNPSACG